MRRPRSRWSRLGATALASCACAGDPGGVPPPAHWVNADGAGASGAYEWRLPPGFPLPAVPEDNPMTRAKVELGRRLFHDPRLSDNGTYSCATCHRQELAFTDGRARALGSTGQVHPRGSMSLANVAYAATLTWGHPLLSSLERQAQLPMFGDAPVELGLRSQAELEARLAQIPEYAQGFAQAFGDEAPAPTLLQVERALASFQRSLISGRAPFDRWLMEGEEDAIGEAAKRGYALFNTETFECYHCHGGFAFTDHVTSAGEAFPGALYHNTGLYNIDGRGAFPAPNTGVASVTEQPMDMGRFKAPTLRNVAVTAPYMHDGSIATLSEVLDHYAAGGRTLSDGPEAGVGSASPMKSIFVRGFRMTDEQRADLLAFLESLTDAEFLTNADHSDPWQ